MRALNTVEVLAVSGGITNPEIFMGTTLAGMGIGGIVGVAAGSAEGGMLAGVFGLALGFVGSVIGGVAGAGVATTIIVGSLIYHSFDKEPEIVRSRPVLV